MIRLLIGFLVSVLKVFMLGFMLIKIWQWYIVPAFSLPELMFYQGTAIVAVLTSIGALVRASNFDPETFDVGYDDDTIHYRVLITQLVLPWIVFLVLIWPISLIIA